MSGGQLFHCGPVKRVFWVCGPSWFLHKAPTTERRADSKAVLRQSSTEAVGSRLLFLLQIIIIPGPLQCRTNHRISFSSYTKNLLEIYLEYTNSTYVSSESRQFLQVWIFQAKYLFRQFCNQKGLEHLLLRLLTSFMLFWFQLYFLICIFNIENFKHAQCMYSIMYYAYIHIYYAHSIMYSIMNPCIYHIASKTTGPYIQSTPINSSLCILRWIL